MPSGIAHKIHSRYFGKVHSSTEGNALEITACSALTFFLWYTSIKNVPQRLVRGNLLGIADKDSNTFKQAKKA